MLFGASGDWEDEPREAAFGDWEEEPREALAACQEDLLVTEMPATETMAGVCCLTADLFDILLR